MAISAQPPPVGSGYEWTSAPSSRRNALSEEPVAAGDVSTSQAQRRRRAASAARPKLPLVIPGGTKVTARFDRGSNFTISPVGGLLVNRVPSGSEVMLSGK